MRFTSAAFLAAVPFAFAQTSTDCNPTEKSCPADTGLNAGSYHADFSQGSSANASWSAAAYTVIGYENGAAEFSIAQAGQAPTIQTDFYFLFARVDVKMKAAPGVGIVSSIVFESDDLDEIDWEFLGGNTLEVETNFFGKGNTTSYDRAVYYPVSAPQDTYHTYTVDWTSERIEWIIDGTTVRTLSYTDALTNGGQNYPQTPMRLKLGNWAGGQPGEPEGTVQWAGGKTDFTKGPFVMYVESVSITNYNPASSYEYGDQSGSYQSIKAIKDGQSSGSGSASASAAVSTGSATGTASVSISASGNATVAPTSSVSVAGVTGQTAAVVSTTVLGSSYSMNTASASAQNQGGSMATSVVTATTQVPGSSPSGSGGSGSGSSGASSTSGGASSSGSAAPSTATNAAAANNVMATGSLLTMLLGFLFV